MAKESFKKEQEFFRTLFFETGAYSRKTFAERLGISVDSYDKTIRKLKEIEAVAYRQEEGGIYSRYKYDYYRTTENILLLFYRIKSLKQSEIEGLALLLKELGRKPYTFSELLALFFANGKEIDEKTVNYSLIN